MDNAYLGPTDTGNHTSDVYWGLVKRKKKQNKIIRGRGEGGLNEITCR